jgi:hypothetical protein
MIAADIVLTDQGGEALHQSERRTHGSPGFLPQRG